VLKFQVVIFAIRKKSRNDLPTKMLRNHLRRRSSSVSNYRFNDDTIDYDRDGLQTPTPPLSDKAVCDGCFDHSLAKDIYQIDTCSLMEILLDPVGIYYVSMIEYGATRIHVGPWHLANLEKTRTVSYTISSKNLTPCMTLALTF
jgi:hypothetical protein